MKPMHLIAAALCAVCLGLLSCKPPYMEVRASPADGFQWPYLIYLPKDTRGSVRTLTVSPNGSPRPSDDFEVHRKRARRQMESLIANLGKYHTAILVSIFPRPQDAMGGAMVLTHSLDRDTMPAARQARRFNVVRVRWSGQMLTEGNSMSFHPADVFVVQDGGVFRCAAMDFDWTTPIVDVAEYEVTFVMQPGIDFARAFNLMERSVQGGTEGCLDFRDVRLDHGGAVVNSVEAGDSRFEITRLLVGGDKEIGPTWDSTGAQRPLDDRYLVDRLDLQLLAMIRDARVRFGLEGYDRRFILIGFSAPGQFSNRFTLLHPEDVRIAVTGGCGDYTAPLAQKDGHALRYPLGTADYDDITGRPFDLEAYRAVDQFLYVGQEDTSDPVAYPDGFEDEDRALVFELFGGEGRNVTRFLNMQKVYEAAGCRATFRVYPGRGHETGPESWDDIRAYLDERLLPAATR